VAKFIILVFLFQTGLRKMQTKNTDSDFFLLNETFIGQNLKSKNQRKRQIKLTTLLATEVVKYIRFRFFTKKEFQKP
jgi:hypothetical protein